MPSSLDVQATYTVRAAALDPTTGAAVSGVKVGRVVITAELLVPPDTGGGGGNLGGGWFLVPGPAA